MASLKSSLTSFPYTITDVKTHIDQHLVDQLGLNKVNDAMKSMSG